MKSQEGLARRAKLALGLSIAFGLALGPATAFSADDTAKLGNGLKQLVAPAAAARASARSAVASDVTVTSPVSPFCGSRIT